MSGMTPLGVPLSFGEGIKMSGSEPRSRRPTSTGSDRSADKSRSAPIEDVYDAARPPEFRARKRGTWHTRPRSPGIKWNKHYNERSEKQGRVFVIDYVKSDLTREGMRKVAAQEISHPDDLEKLYSNQERYDDAVLRLFHVQNAEWAVQYLLKKYFPPYDDLGRDFGKYASYRWPEIRGGKAILRGKTWPAQHEPDRNLIKTAFGLDYYKLYKVRDPLEQMGRSKRGKVMELNCFDESNERPVCGWEAFAQRISCYVQQQENAPDSLGTPDPSQSRRGSKHAPYHELDNGNVVLIIENCKNHSINDTLISARQKWESRWRRLPFYLAYESEAASDDNQLALQCMKLILKDVWRANAENWTKFLDIAGTHVGILEDKIYEFPADESRADEIWMNSSNWLKSERTMISHLDTINEVQSNLKELADDPGSTDNTWLETNQAEFERLSARVGEDLVKPTANLSDLMYKSVGIRDTRHSLELSYSMWRLSWITFIFLPLTFTVGFFGMNVDTFVPTPPSVSWFFVVAVPLMVVVLIGYTFLQRQVARSRPDPYPRGIYERLFQEMSAEHPLLWSRAGPRDLLADAQPRADGTATSGGRVRRAGFVRGRADAIKWNLVRRWNTPEDTIARDVHAGRDQFDGLSSWSRVKRSLTRRWTAEIGNSVSRRLREPDSAESGHGAGHANGGVTGEAVLSGEKAKRRGGASELVGREDSDQEDPTMLRVPPLHSAKTAPLQRSSSRDSDEVSRPGSSSGGEGGTGLMVEEQKAGWLRSTVI